MPLQPTIFTFDQVYRKYFRTMVLFAKKFLRDEQRADDQAVDAFMKLHKRGPLYIETEAKAFLYIIIRNQCLNALQKKDHERKMHQKFLNLQTEQEPPNFFHEIVRAECMREIMEALESLPPECRKILKMRYLEQIHWKEIAVMLQLSKHTVKNQIARGMLLLRRRLTKLPESDGFL